MSTSQETTRRGSLILIGLFGISCFLSPLLLEHLGIISSDDPDSGNSKLSPKDKNRIVPDKWETKNLYQQPFYSLDKVLYFTPQSQPVTIFCQSISPARFTLSVLEQIYTKKDPHSFKLLEKFSAKASAKGAISLFPGPSYRQGHLLYPLSVNGKIQASDLKISEPDNARMLVINPNGFEITEFDPQLLTKPENIVIGCENTLASENWKEWRARTVAAVDNNGVLRVMTFTGANRRVVNGFLEATGQNPYMVANLSGGSATGLRVNNTTYLKSTETTRHVLIAHPRQ